jgi:hypothetical protein
MSKNCKTKNPAWSFSGRGFEFRTLFLLVLIPLRPFYSSL